MFPFASVAVHITVVFPNGNATGALLVVVVPAQLSFSNGAPSGTPVAVQPVFVVVNTVAGQVIDGALLSCTVTVAVQVEVFPLPSVTLSIIGTSVVYLRSSDSVIAGNVQLYCYIPANICWSDRILHRDHGQADVVISAVIRYDKRHIIGPKVIAIEVCLACRVAGDVPVVSGATI